MRTATARLLDAAPLVALFSGACFAETSRYSVDPDQSVVGFSVVHMLRLKTTRRVIDFVGFLDMDVDTKAIMAIEGVMLGETREVDLVGTFNGTLPKDVHGDTRIGFTAEGRLNRKATFRRRRRQTRGRRLRKEGVCVTTQSMPFPMEGNDEHPRTPQTASPRVGEGFASPNSGRASPRPARGLSGWMRKPSVPDTAAAR